MKLKRILSALLAISVMAVSSVSVYADPAYSSGSEKFIIGNPIDLETGETVEVSDIEADQLLAFPVDIDGVTATPSYTLKATYDTDYLSPGIDTTALTLTGSTIGFNGAALGALVTANNDSTKYIGIDALGTDTTQQYYGILYIYQFSSAFTSGGTVAGSYTGTNTVTIVGTNPYDVTINADSPEFYVLFTAKAAIDSDALNLNLFEANTEDSMLAVDGTSYHGITADQEQANACYGAFKVDVDNDEFAESGIWITAINANIYTDYTMETPLGSYQLSEYVNEDGSTVYSFPTRITTNSDDYESAYVQIVADTNTLENESGTDGTLTLGAATISLDSSVTSYQSTIMLQ